MWTWCRSPAPAAPAPYPSLVSPGRDDEDGHVLLDLETIAGHQDVRSLLTGLAQRRQDDTDESHAERMAAAVESLTRSVNARANISARLIETLKHIIPLERQAWKIDTGGTPPPPPSDAESQSAEEAYKRMLGGV